MANVRIRLTEVVDSSTIRLMAQNTSHQNRKIVGFSLPPDMARAVKAEAAQRGLSLRKLFEEMWQLYLAQKGKKAR